ncbi:cytochrome c oxidase biogenesis protein Cmc1 like-domain-containing protein [Talaromyces proteolyticus]|uniref:COX assembly mitochondrial protein n=1 Tax=Talaromyces proteolyticus TaxID=1131652 RepID=A0AAD4KUS8_9EURO|nr:cytochrome c oxidase biogenesis protein Cmc1 like-domain-containing protein [Talaromyces proteolyticus]KAH8698814.1 cytochrome c oxidase biogenesis protein Cmc1 like-domain-containing protein [Talaromyces proteolyticus]
MSAPSTSTEPSTAQPNFNLRNPLPLSATQEQQVKDIYYKRVRGYCAPEIKAFADCARNRTFTTTWVCREQRLAMNSCMLAHAGPEEEDRAREEWFASRDARRREREEKEAAVEKRRTEVIQLMRAEDERPKGEK